MGLTSAQSAAAIRFNINASQIHGWNSFSGAIASSLCLPETVKPNTGRFAQAVADFQEKCLMKPDGMLGQKTLTAIRNAFPKVDAIMTSLVGSHTSGPHAAEYRTLYESASFRSQWTREIGAAAAKILSNKMRYLPVSFMAEVPWFLIGLVHMREASFNFRTYLHNGDPLKDRAGNPLKTVHVPAGKLFFTWEEAAGDAIETHRASGLTIHRGDVAAELEFLERFNGLGYRKRGIKTPYLWSGTNHYEKGKYTADGSFNPAAIDKQVGCAAVRKFMEKNGMLG